MTTINDSHSGRDPVEALASEFLERQRLGETPTIAEYVQKYPPLADEIRDLFPTIAVMEELKSHKDASSGQHALLHGVELEKLGDFRILREIGRGGMGIVYEAVQQSLGRRVAVKVLPRQTLWDEKHIARFQREARTAAGLHHTNIVPVFGVGQQDGHHYYVMQVIHGVGLDEVVRQLKDAGGDETPDVSAVVRSAVDARWPAERDSERAVDDVPATSRKDCFQTVARIGLQVAEALRYAHAEGTLHRDVKPANLLIDARGVVWVADFGLAKPIEPDGLSHSGTVLGTLRYMAPEQLAGQAEAASDVYSLGLTLYELLTLRPAFDDSNPSSMLRQITDETPPRPRKVDPRVPRDLETVVLKATATETAHRYRSAGELADDLRRFLDDRPVRARRVGVVEQAWRWSRRNRSTAVLACAVVALLAAIITVATSGYLQTRDALVGESRQRERAEATSKLAQDALDSIF